MLADGSRPDPSALAEGNFAADREGRVLEIILTGASEGTNEAILDYLVANPPEGYRGLIREPTVRCFTRSAVEAGIIEARKIGDRTVYIPLADGPPFARATEAGLEFRRRVMEDPRSSPSEPLPSRPRSPSDTGSLRAHVRARMKDLENSGLGTATFGDSRDKFQLANDLPPSNRLTHSPQSPSFIRSENGTLLFRDPAEDFLAEASVIAEGAQKPGSAKGLEFGWRLLDTADIDRLFEIVSTIAGSALRPSAVRRQVTADTPERIRGLDCGVLGLAHRDWVLNDANHRHYHNVVKLSETPLDIRLSWRAAPETAVVLLGCFRLNLPQLLEDGYVRRESEGEHISDLRLRFFRADDGVVHVQARSDSPGLPVAGLEPAALRSVPGNLPLSEID